MPNKLLQSLKTKALIFIIMILSLSALGNIQLSTNLLSWSPGYPGLVVTQYVGITNIGVEALEGAGSSDSANIILMITNYNLASEEGILIPIECHHNDVGEISGDITFSGGEGAVLSYSSYTLELSEMHFYATNAWIDITTPRTWINYPNDGYIIYNGYAGDDPTLEGTARFWFYWTNTVGATNFAIQSVFMAINEYQNSVWLDINSVPDNPTNKIWDAPVYEETPYFQTNYISWRGTNITDGYFTNAQYSPVIWSNVPYGPVQLIVVGNEYDMRLFEFEVQPVDSGIAPTIVINPVSSTNTEGTAKLFWVMAIGTAPLSYQWRFNESNLDGKTGAELSFEALEIDDSGSYDVIVTNSYGAVTSQIATLLVATAPYISVQPTNQWARVGSNFTFSVVAGGSETLYYQWQHNGINIDVDGNLSAYHPPDYSSSAENEGGYRCIVTNVVGSTTSSTAGLTLMMPGVHPAVLQILMR